MSLRKWIIRGILLMMTLMLGGAYYVYGQYTNPEAVAQLVLAELKQHFPEADIQLGHAEWRLFGGVELNDLKVTPRDQPGRQPAAILRQTRLKIDKAQLAQGKFELQKVILDQPILNLDRDEQGRWNVLSLLTAKPKASGTIPFVFLSKGTIRFHDRRLDFPILELNNVEAKLNPQPQGMLVGEGHGQSSLLGQIQFRFSHDPVKDCTELSFTIPGIEYQPKLEEIIVKLLPFWREQQIRVRGKLALDTRLTWYPHQDIPVIESTLRLQDGEIHHPRLPVPLKEIKADIEYQPDLLLIRSITAQAEQGSLNGQGRVNLASDIRLLKEHKAVLHLEYQNIHLHKGVYPSLPPVLRKFCEEMQTAGMINGSLDVTWQNQQLGIGYVLRPFQGAFTADDFPYPASNVTGLLQYTEQGETPLLQVDLRGEFSGRPFKLQGELNGSGLRPDNKLKPGINLQIIAEGMPLDANLLRALEPYPETLRVIKQFHAAGFIDCDIRLQRNAGQHDGDKPLIQRWVKAQLRDVRFRFDPFPCPVEKASGRLDINPDKSWRITQFKGEHRGGAVTGQAWMAGTSAGDVLHVDLHAKELPFSNDLYEALPVEVQTVWKHMKPVGRADCHVTFEKLEKGKPVIDVDLSTKGISIQPTCFPYQMDNLQGSFRFANQQVLIGCLTATHGQTAISLDGGHVTVRPHAGFLVQLHGMNLDQVAVDDDLLKALPPMLRDSVAALNPDKPFKVRLNLDVDEPGDEKPVRMAWNGSLEFNQTQFQCGTQLKDVTGVLLIEQGTYDAGKVNCTGQLYLRSMDIAGKQTIGPVHSKILLTQHALQLHDAQARVPGGGVRGLIEVKFGAAHRYHLDLTADVMLEQFFAQNRELKGRALAKLRLNGEGSNLRNLYGDGSILVEQGAQLYQLPLLIDIFNQFSQMLPKATNFQTAKVDFAVQGDRVTAQKLQLLGDAYSIEGSGSVKLDGRELNLVLTMVMGGRTLPLMPAALDTLNKTIAKGLMKVNVTGSIDKVEVHVAPVPFLTQPIRDIIQSVGGRN